MKTISRTYNTKQNQTAHFFNPHEDKNVFFSYDNLSNKAFFDSKKNQPILEVALTNASSINNNGKRTERMSKAPNQCKCEECSSCKKEREEKDPLTSFQEVPHEKFNNDDEKMPFEVNNHRINDNANTIKCENETLVVHLGGHDENSCEADKDCTREHEEQHIIDWQNHYGNNLCENVPDNHLPIGGDGYEEMLETSECNAYRVGKRCRDNALNEGESGCDDALRNAIQRDENQISNYCND